MRRWAGIPLLIVVAYGALLGYFGWSTFVAHVIPDYRGEVSWEAPWIAPREGAPKVAYFRKKIHIASEPARGWLTVMAPDGFEVYVNGVHAATRSYVSGYAQAVVNIGPRLVVGTNVIAIRNDLGTYPQTTRVVVQGEYADWAGRTFTIRSGADWKTASRDESLTSQGGVIKPTPWYAADFDDGQWRYAVEGDPPQETMTQALEFPPALVTRPFAPEWLWTGEGDAAEAYFRLALDLPARPRDAWLRIAVRRSFRLLVNGHAIASDELTVGTAGPRAGLSALRSYDVAPFLREGRNVIAVQAAGERSDRGLRVDGFVQHTDGPRTWFSFTGARVSTTPAPGWTDAAFDDSGWARVGLTRPAVPPDQARLFNLVTPVEPPLAFQLRTLGELAASLAAAIAGCLLLAAGSAWVLGRLTGTSPRAVAPWVSLTCLLPGLLLGAVYALGFEARLTPAYPYQPRFVLASVALLLGLHAVLIVGAVVARLLGRVRPAEDAAAPAAPVRRRRNFDLGWIVVLLLVVPGFHVRLQDVASESLIVDEITGMNWTLGVLERGYPSMVIDGRVRPATTSELVYFLKAPSVWFWGPNAYGLRFHDVVFGTLTIPLFFAVGRWLHGRRAGLLAAAIYTILPSVIGLTHYGRYPSQQMFFSVLTIGLLHRALEGGTVRPRLYYLATAAYIATHLSWEGAAFLLPAVTVGVMAMTRPRFGWMRSGHVWTGVGIVVTLVFFQLCHRFILQSEWFYYGTGAQDVAPALMWRFPYFSATYYFFNFFLLETQHVLALVFFLGVPLWFRTSREGRTLAYLGITVLVTLAEATLLLELQHWRYVYYAFPALVLGVAITAIVFLDALTRLARSTEPGRVPLGLVRGLRHVTAAAVVGLMLVLSTTFVVKLYNTPGLKKSIHTRFGQWSFSEFTGAGEYLREHVRPGDVVVSGKPSVVRFYSGVATYYLQSELRRPLLLGSDPGSPIHRTTGLLTIRTASELRDVLARSPRVWYIFSAGDEDITDQAMISVIKKDMWPVYEDYLSVVYMSWPGRALEAAASAPGR